MRRHETRVRSLDWEDPLEEGMATHSSILTWTEFHGQRSLAGYRVAQSPTRMKRPSRPNGLLTQSYQFVIHDCPLEVKLKLGLHNHAK